MKVGSDPRLPLGDLGRLIVRLYDVFREYARAVNDLDDRSVLRGEGTPEGAVTASVGRLYVDTTGGAGTVLYVKESGDATDTGWVAK